MHMKICMYVVILTKKLINKNKNINKQKNLLVNCGKFYR